MARYRTRGANAPRGPAGPMRALQFILASNYNWLKANCAGVRQVNLPGYTALLPTAVGDSVMPVPAANVKKSKVSRSAPPAAAWNAPYRASEMSCRSPLSCGLVGGG